MAVFGKWKKYFLVAVLMLVLCCGHSQTAAKSGERCDWFYAINSFCESCLFLEEETLDCSNENLNFIRVIGSNQMVGLDASHNQLSTTPVIRDCPNLVWIDLSYNEKLIVVNNQTFRNMKSGSLKLINLNNCRVLLFQPPPFKDIFPKLEIFLIANNSLAQLNMSFFQKLESFMLLNIRGNRIQQPTSLCKMMEQNATILVEGGYCGISCDNFCQKYNLTYPLSFCLQDGQGKCPQTSLHSSTVEGRVVSTWDTTITSRTSIITTGTTGYGTEHLQNRTSSASIIFTATTEESATSTSMMETEWLNSTIISASCAGFLVFVLLLFYHIRRYLKRKRRQNQYNRWLAVYTPPETVCTFQKRVSFSGEIVIEQSGESITKKSLNSDESKKRCNRQFDINLLIRTQSLPLPREEEDEQPGRVFSWI